MKKQLYITFLTVLLCFLNLTACSRQNTLSNNQTDVMQVQENVEFPEIYQNSEDEKVNFDTDIIINNKDLQTALMETKGRRQKITIDKAYETFFKNKEVQQKYEDTITDETGESYEAFDYQATDGNHLSVNAYRIFYSTSLFYDVLNAFTLDEDNIYYNYSMGMKQRLAIAQAIMENQEILILDEPMNGLDKKGVAEMRKLFLELKKQEKLILMASHNKEDIDILCDEVYEMDNGSIVKVR